MLVMVFLRAPGATDAAPVTIPVGAGGSEAPYTPIATEPVQVGPSWKRYYVSGVATKPMRRARRTSPCSSPVPSR